MDEKSRKKSIYFVIALVVVFAGYQTLMNYKPIQETERQKAYFEANKHPLTASDSVEIKSFYDKLCLVFHTVSNDTSEVKAFSKIDKSKLPKDFEPQLCSDEYLDLLCNGPIQRHRLRDKERPDLKLYLRWYEEEDLHKKLNNLFGLEDFNSNIRHKIWNGSVKSEIQYFEKDKYLMVMDFSEIVRPDFDESTERFFIGHCKGNVKVVDVNTGELVAMMSFFAKNDDSIKSYPLVKRAMDDKLNDNLVVNIRKALNKCALALFDKPLNQMNTEMY